jgi:hypothetical protein
MSAGAAEHYEQLANDILKQAFSSSELAAYLALAQVYATLAVAQRLEALV